jgi:hypothetical protein
MNLLYFGAFKETSMTIFITLLTILFAVISIVPMFINESDGLVSLPE